jgi:hypothetical protein
MRYILHFLSTLSFLLIINCSDDSPVVPQPVQTGSLKVKVHLSEVGKLAKRAAINLQFCQIKLYAPEEDTIVDSLPLSGNGQASLTTVFSNLASGKKWSVAVTSFDNNDSTIHYGTTDTLVQAGDTALVSLTISPEFSMLRANFFPIRNRVDRIELKVDGQIKDDTSFLAQSLLGDTLALTFDYLPANGNLGFVHHIQLGAYGGNELLYYGDTSIQIYPSMSTTIQLPLYWTGDSIVPVDTSLGALTMQVVLGAIATVNIDGELLPDTVAPPPASVPSLTLLHGIASDVQVSGNYASWRSGNQVMLYDGASVQQISSNTSNPGKIVMKNNKVAWEINDGSDNEIYCYNGNRTIRLTDNSTDDSISLISDSVVVWYSHDGNDHELYCSILGDTAIRLTNNSVNDYAAACKGTRIFWRASDGNDDEIFWFDGDSVRQLTSNTANDYPLGMCNYDFIWNAAGTNTTNIFNGTTITTLLSNQSSITRDAACDSVLFLKTTTASNSEYHKVNAAGIKKIWTGSLTTPSSAKVSIGEIAIYYTSTPYNLFFCNQDTARLIMMFSSPYTGFDILNNTLTWTVSDGHDLEIYYKNVANSVIRVTSNNDDDTIPCSVPGGVIFKGTDSNGETGLVYWNGTTSKRFSTIVSGTFYHVGNNLLMATSTGSTALYKIEF